MELGAGILKKGAKVSVLTPRRNPVNLVLQQVQQPGLPQTVTPSAETAAPGKAVAGGGSTKAIVGSGSHTAVL